MSKSKLQKERRLAKSLKRSARKKRKKLEKTKAMEFEETDREEEGTDSDTDINYNIKVNNAFESLKSDPQEPPEVTPETIVKLRPDHPPTPSIPTTTDMDEMSEVFFKELSNSGQCHLHPITSEFNEHDLFKAWQSAVNNILSRNVDWRDWRGLSINQYQVVHGELRNSIMELYGQRYVRPSMQDLDQFLIAGYNTLDTFIKQFFRKSQEASELAPTQEDET